MRKTRGGLVRGRRLSPIFPAATALFPKLRASYFRFACFNTSPLYYLRAWHRLGFPRPGNPLSQGKILSCKRLKVADLLYIKSTLAVALHRYIKGNNRKPQHWKLQQEQQVGKNTWFSSIFLVYVLSDRSIILKKCAPRWRGCKIACKKGYFFTPPKRATSDNWGPPPPCEQALKLNFPLRAVAFIRDGKEMCKKAWYTCEVVAETFSLRPQRGFRNMVFRKRNQFSRRLNATYSFQPYMS